MSRLDRVAFFCKMSLNLQKDLIMGKLNSNEIRAKSMTEFLQDFDLKREDLEVRNVESYYHFSFKEYDQQFAQKLAPLLQDKDSKTPFQRVLLSDIVAKELAQAKTSMEINRNACILLFELIVSQQRYFIFHKDTFLLEILPPNEAYVPMFKLLDFPNMRLNDQGYLEVDVKKIVDQLQQPIIEIAGFNPHQAPLLILNTNALSGKKVICARKEKEGVQEITPYFFAPFSKTAPHYYFALDMSRSMGADYHDATIFKTLVKSVKESVAELFLLHPQAKITVLTFDENIVSLGTFKADDFNLFEDKINALRTNPSSNRVLNEAIAYIMKQFKPEHQANVLIFTYGFDEGSNPKVAPKIEQNLQHVRKGKDKVIIYHKVTSDALMDKVTKAFGGELVNCARPNLLDGDLYVERLAKWAATQEAFVVKCSGESLEESSIIEVMNLSGQITPLKTITCPLNTSLRIEIKGNDGSVTYEQKPVKVQGEFNFFSGILSGGILKTLDSSLTLGS